MKTTMILGAGLMLLAATAARAGTVAGTYDGFCDGFSLTTASNGAAYGVETGCDSGSIAGRRVKSFAGGEKGPGLVINEPHELSAVYEINTRNHTWAIYYSDGSILQSGTWTPTDGPLDHAIAGLKATGQR